MGAGAGVELWGFVVVVIVPVVVVGGDWVIGKGCGGSGSGGDVLGY